MLIMSGELDRRPQSRDISRIIRPDDKSLVIVMIKDDPQIPEGTGNGQVVGFIRVRGHDRLAPHQHTEHQRVQEEHARLKAQTGATHYAFLRADEARRIAEGNPQTPIGEMLSRQRQFDSSTPIVDIEAGK